jgi:hypothetical protein
MSKHLQSGSLFVRNAIVCGATLAVGALAACASDTSGPHTGNAGAMNVAGAVGLAGAPAAGAPANIAGAPAAGAPAGGGSEGSSAGSSNGGSSGGLSTAGAGGSGGRMGGGGGSGGGSTAGSGGGGSADCSTYKLCDGFEGDAPGMGKSPWKVTQGSGYTVVVDTTQAHGGTHSVHITAPTAAGSGVLKETSTFPATDFWGRAFMRFKAAAGGHQMFIAVLVQGGDQFRFLNTLGSNAIQTNEQNGDKFFASKSTVPMETWFCYEWHVTPTSAAVYLDGKELTDAAPTGWKISNAQTLQIGYQRFQSGPSMGEIWLDDIAVNDKQIGCQ